MKSMIVFVTGPLARRVHRSPRGIRRWAAASGLWLTLGVTAILAGCAGPSGPEPSSARSLAPIDPAQRNEVVMTALSLLDTQYRYGSARPARGFDCSGLVKYVFATATRTTLPHSTDQIARMSRPISRSKLQPGDLVFFNTSGRPNSHMGIYLGDGRFINAPSTGGQVRIDSMNNPYYRKHFQSVGTLFAG